MPSKLNDEKVRWIIREVEKGRLTRSRIAWAQKVSEARICQLWREYLRTGETPS